MVEFHLMVGIGRGNVSTPSLGSVRQKHFRSVIHLKELIAELGRYFQTNPGAMLLEPGCDLDNPVVSFQAEEAIPAKFGLIIGDCLQNLRSSLDYLVWELVLAARNSPSGDNMFPICSTREKFENALKRKRLEGVSDDAKAVIESLQPYHSDESNKSDVLLVLDELSNINKHKRILLTVLDSVVIPGTIPSDAEQPAFGYDPVPDVGDNPIFRPVKFSENTQVNAKLVAFMAFNEKPVINVNVTEWLGALAEYLGDEIIPRFSNFF